jgi:hypothetical protein
MHHEQPIHTLSIPTNSNPCLRVSDFLKSKCSASVRQMIIGSWDLVSFEVHTHTARLAHTPNIPWAPVAQGYWCIQQTTMSPS